MFFKQVSKNWILSALSLGAFQCLFAQSLSAHELQFELDEQRKLSEIQFPNGSIHRVSYDRDGKVAENSRTGLGRIEYHRHPKLGFLQGKSYFNSEGKLDRTESYEYDDQARLVTLRQTLAEPTEGLSGDRVFRFFYDGNLPSGAVLPGQVGRLTAVLGPDFIKTMEYAEGERIQSVTMEFPGWNQMTRQFEYDHSGRMREARLISEGAVTTSKVENYEWDASDRISKILFNGNPFATFGEGLENSVQLPNGDQISWIQDPVTQQVSGYEGQIAGVPVSQKWHRAAASGQIQSESLEVSGSVHQRDYHYSAQGLLSGESTTSGATKYFHDDAGLIHSWTDGDQKSLVESHDGNWAVEKGKQTQAYLLDSMGRVIYKQGRYFEYGPSGRVEKLTLPGQDPVFYSYDELGNRILKRTKARILEAYWGDVVIQDSRVMQPVRVRGLVVGVMQNNHFVPIASDRTGKAILGQDQCVDLATSYGERKSRPSECSSVLDSATHGFDSDLDAYRMGVRDYDSKMKRFLTPDPFFFENPQMCLSRPFECNL